MHDENHEENLKENVALGNPRKGDRPFFPPGLIAVLLDGLSERRTTLVYRKYSGQDNQCDIYTAHNGKVGCITIKYKIANPVF